MDLSSAIKNALSGKDNDVNETPDLTDLIEENRPAGDDPEQMEIPFEDDGRMSVQVVTYLLRRAYGTGVIYGATEFIPFISNEEDLENAFQDFLLAELIEAAAGLGIDLNDL